MPMRTLPVRLIRSQVDSVFDCARAGTDAATTAVAAATIAVAEATSRRRIPISHLLSAVDLSYRRPGLRRFRSQSARGGGTRQESRCRASRPSSDAREGRKMRAKKGLSSRAPRGTFKAQAKVPRCARDDTVRLHY